METSEIAEFLETDELSFTYTAGGLKYLSLKGGGGEQMLELRGVQGNQNSITTLLLEETAKFLKTGKHDLTLDLTEFTDFQKAVFNRVLKIPPGDVLTYGHLAIELGKPNAARVVGQAISKNPVSYFIPTHRVLPQKGIGQCISGAGFLREKLLVREGHDLAALAKRR